MHLLFVIGEWLLVLAMLGLFAVLAWMIVTLISLKNSVMKNGKRLSERPIRAVKNLTATGKGIVQQEGVRVQHIIGSGKVAVNAVRDTTVEIKTAVKSVDLQDLKPILSNAQTTLKLVSTVMRLVKNASAQQATENVS